MYEKSKIKSVHLVNFQIFSDRKIEFDKGMNVLFGENNSGKSSIMRAVYWTQTNKPAGEWMCKDGPDGDPLVASVCIEYADGVKITRTRGPKVNAYYFFDGTKKHTFEKFGRSGIPAPIQEYLGKTKLPINSDLVPNIAMQDEQPFMVFESGPTKGSLINYLTGVNVADKIKKDLSSEVRAYNKEVVASETRLDDVCAELLQYEDLSGQLRTLEKIEARLDLVTQCKKAICILEGYTEMKAKAIQVEQQIKDTEVILTAFSNLPTQVKQQKATEDCLELARRCLRRKPVLGAIAVLTKGLKRIQVPMVKADDYYEKAATLKNLADERESLVDDVVRVTTEIDRVSAKLLEFEGQQCPVCNGVIHV